VEVGGEPCGGASDFSPRGLYSLAVLPTFVTLVKGMGKGYSWKQWAESNFAKGFGVIWRASAGGACPAAVDEWRELRARSRTQRMKQREPRGQPRTCLAAAAAIAASLLFGLC
jgi:hypothetical protein